MMNLMTVQQDTSVNKENVDLNVWTQHFVSMVH